MYWYILFVHTGREHKVEELLKKRLDSAVFVPFIPLHEKYFKISGVVKKELKPLFPGYVFIESDVSSQKFIEGIGSLIYNLRDVVRILRYSDTEIAMRECEMSMLQNLCNDDYCIESSSGIVEGDRIHITDGPLKGLESIVRKVNRHKSQAWIELKFMGDNRLINMALEIVQKA